MPAPARPGISPRLGEVRDGSPSVLSLGTHSWWPLVSSGVSSGVRLAGYMHRRTNKRVDFSEVNRSFDYCIVACATSTMLRNAKKKHSFFKVMEWNVHKTTLFSDKYNAFSCCCLAIVVVVVVVVVVAVVVVIIIVYWR